MLSGYSNHIVQWKSQDTKILTQVQFDRRADLMIAKIRPKDTQSALYDYEKAFNSPAAKGIFRINQFIAGYLYFYYVNSNPDYTLKESVTMQELDGLEICDTQDGENMNFAVEVKPSQQKIIKYRKIPGAEVLSYSCSSKISLSRWVSGINFH